MTNGRSADPPYYYVVATSSLLKISHAVGPEAWRTLHCGLARTVDLPAMRRRFVGTLPYPQNSLAHSRQIVGQSLTREDQAEPTDWRRLADVLPMVFSDSPTIYEYLADDLPTIYRIFAHDVPTICPWFSNDLLMSFRRSADEFPTISR